jgi:hypothetical protein
MMTTTKKEEATLELQGARARLSKVLRELELQRGQKGLDEYEYSRLCVEYDEASRAVMKARQALDSL